MDPLANPRTASAMESLTRWMLRRICTSNPFYVISALFVCLGLRMSYDPQARVIQTWALMGGMAAYTLLLAMTACVLVRLGNVWEDVRSLLLLVVLMFLALSVTFDDILGRDPRQGVACYLAGLAFSVAVTEGLLKGMRFSLPIAYRLPYHLILALFFLYPVALVPLLGDPDSPRLHWALFGFSPTAGLLSLTLLPAIRRGPRYLDGNGSPWRWPLYPWAVFVFLGLGVCARSYYLCWSMHYLAGRDLFGNLFGPYFLAPFLLAVGVLLLEVGLVSRDAGALRVALAVPPALLALAMVGHRPDPVFQRFLATFREGLGGSPLHVTLVAATSFYAFAWLRGVRSASGPVVTCLALMSVVGPDTRTLEELAPPRAWPLLAAAALQGGWALRRRDSLRIAVAAGLLVVGITFVLGSGWTPAWRELLAAHLGLVAAMAIGAAFDDPFARLLRGAGALLGLVAGLVSAAGPAGPLATLPEEVRTAYPLILIATAAGYGGLIGHRASVAAAGAGLACWLGVAGAQAYAVARRHVGGLDQIALGLASLALAASISLGKAGLWSRWLVALRKRRIDAARWFGP